MESKAIMSAKKRAWWASRTPEQLEATKRKIGASSKGRIKGGALHPAWRGGRYTSKRDGYVHIRVEGHPHARSNKRGGGSYVLEHRYVMEQRLGRYLHPDEDVNHINGIKDDNRVENLRVVSHYAHYEEHGCPNCGHKVFTR